MTKRMVDSQTANKDTDGNFASVNGLRIYYEMRGTGEPLVLLHGGVGASEMFDPILPVFSTNWKVIAAHLQGHGRTTDIDRPPGFESMANDIAALMKHLGIEKADILGYSLGGRRRLADRHPIPGFGPQARAHL